MPARDRIPFGSYSEMFQCKVKPYEWLRRKRKVPDENVCGATQGPVANDLIIHRNRVSKVRMGSWYGIKEA